MTGKDLFHAMTHVDDELVAEAEHKEWDGGKKHAGRKKYWATMAACLCVLAISAAVITVYQRSGEVNKSSASDAAAGGGQTVFGGRSEAAEGGAEKERAALEQAQESNDAVDEQKSASVEQEESVGFGESQNLNKKMSGSGTWSCTEEVAETLETYSGQSVQYLLVFDLSGEAGELDKNSEQYKAECERLKDAGYHMQSISYWNYDANGEKKKQTVTAGLYTAQELEEFQADDKYEYVFRFWKNGDGSAVSCPVENVIVSGVSEP